MQGYRQEELQNDYYNTMISNIQISKYTFSVKYHYKFIHRVFYG